MKDYTIQFRSIKGNIGTTPITAPDAKSAGDAVQQYPNVLCLISIIEIIPGTSVFLPDADIIRYRSLDPYPVLSTMGRE